MEKEKCYFHLYFQALTMENVSTEVDALEVKGDEVTETEKTTVAAETMENGVDETKENGITEVKENGVEESNENGVPESNENGVVENEATKDAETGQNVPNPIFKTVEGILTKVVKL